MRLGRFRRNALRPDGAPAEGHKRQAVDWPTRLVAVALAILLSALQVWNPALLDAARLRIFDQLQRLSPRQPASPRPILIVDIDDPSLVEIGQWPWPRDVFSNLIDRLGDLGAKVVVFDVLFSEADRLSPPRYADLIEPINRQVATVLRYMPGNEEIMGDAMRRHPVVLGSAGTNQAQRRLPGGTEVPAKIAWLGEGAKPAALTQFKYGVMVLPVLSRTAQGVGLTTVLPEIDGVIRRAPMLAQVGDVVMPSLAAEAVRVVGGESTVVVRGDDVAIREAAVGDSVLPTDTDGRAWLHFAPRDPSLYVSAMDLLQGKVPREKVEGRIVLVGSSAAGLGDVQVTPIDRSVPGVEIQAQFVESIMSGDILRRPRELPAAERILVGAGGLLLAWFGVLLPASFFPPLLAAVVVVGGALTWLAFTGYNLLLDGIYPAFAFGVILFWLAMGKYIREEMRRQSLRSAFGQYLSPVMVDRVASSPDALSLSGERRDLSILFSDVRDFTTWTEQYAESPERLTAILNRYFTAMTEVILDNEGTIDKYIGDAIMAFWNAPLDVPQHPRNACLAALGMLRRLDELNKELGLEAQEAGLPYRPIRIGVGIETGLAFVGNMGSRQRFNYSVIGDSVNVAARLESQCKTYGMQILVGDNVRNAAPDLAYLEVDETLLKGKTVASRIWAVVGDDRLATTPGFAELATDQETAVHAIAEGDESKAQAAMARARQQAEKLGLGTLYAGYVTAVSKRLKVAA